jgi:hypothetical protein
MQALTALLLTMALHAECRKVPRWVDMFMGQPREVQEQAFAKLDPERKLELAIYAPRMTEPPDLSFALKAARLGRELAPLAEHLAPCVHDDAVDSLLRVLDLANKRHYRLKNEKGLRKSMFARIEQIASEGQRYDCSQIARRIWPVLP